MSSEYVLWGTTIKVFHLHLCVAFVISHILLLYCIMTWRQSYGWSRKHSISVWIHHTT